MGLEEHHLMNLFLVWYSVEHTKGDYGSILI